MKKAVLVLLIVLLGSSLSVATGEAQGSFSWYGTGDWTASRK